MEVLWLSIGATLMGLASLFLIFEYFSKMGDLIVSDTSEECDGCDVERSEIMNDKKKKKNKRDQGLLVLLVVIVAFFSYISMLFASLYSSHENVVIIRYVEWFITTPLLLIDLAIIAYLARYHIQNMVILDLLMITLGLAAVYSTNFYMKYTLFTLSTIAMIFIFIILFLPENKPADIDEQTLEKSRKANIFTTVLWSLYPIVWILSHQGFHIISIPGATLAYMILDVLAKAVFGIFFVFSR